MRRLIINADDFGLSDGVCLGILEAMDQGAVTSTTGMACAPGSLARLERWADRVAGRIGVHLQLTNGRPCLEAAETPSLVDESGNFPLSWRGLKRCDPDEVGAEWRAQIERIKALGIEPTHLDSHHNVHLKPEIFPVYCDLAKEAGLPARAGGMRLIPELLKINKVDCANYAEIELSSGPITLERLLDLLERAFERCGGAGVVELMCHPGRVDDELRAQSHYLENREAELAILCRPDLSERIAALGIELVGQVALSGRR